jgi:hypothetical protein
MHAQTSSVDKRPFLPISISILKRLKLLNFAITSASRRQVPGMTWAVRLARGHHRKKIHKRLA